MGQMYFPKENDQNTQDDNNHDWKLGCGSMVIIIILLVILYYLGILK